jgi:hypothetical protein
MFFINTGDIELGSLNSVYGNRGIVIRLVYLQVAILSWIISGFGWINRKKNIVLCYHGVNNNQLKSFRQQMKKFVPNHSDFICYKGRKEIQNTSVLYTFDDAFENLLGMLYLFLSVCVSAMVFA